MVLYVLEAPTGFEPAKKGFADLCVTIPPQRHYREEHRCIISKMNVLGYLLFFFIILTKPTPAAAAAVIAMAPTAPMVNFLVVDMPSPASGGT